jgi:hypothetical protein
MANQLQDESSLYLKQHKDNPVNWFPWTKSAFDLAKKENKPIFLSIGYSACHWCHVMAHECFEDKGVAKLMNENFINIKVDKEERPDIDQIYQTAHYIFSQRPGGWPLSVFLTPDQEPYYIGTYFPKSPKHNLPAFPQLITRLSEFFHKEKEILSKQTLQLKEIINSMRPEKSKLINFSKDDIKKTIIAISKNFDKDNGGLGGAPKFPNEPVMRFLIDQKSPEAKEIIKLSFEKMLQGGLFDHIEGGFFRYCVDIDWSIPHYEKMLYNSAQLIELYSLIYQSNKDKKINDSIYLTIRWLTEEMQSQEGGFFASMDADSKNEQGDMEEGAYYNWSLEELKENLTPDEFLELFKWFYLDGEPNYEGKTWHLNLKIFDGVAKCKDIREKLNTIRKARTKPTTDKKIITSWNALLIKSLLVAGDIFDEPQWIKLAQEAIDFIFNNLFRDEKLKSIYIDKKPLLNGYLDDYAFLLDALIQSIQTNYRECDLHHAIQLGGILKEKFQSEDGAYYFTENEHESLFDRQMIAEDNAIPSGNGLTCLALQKLSQITSDYSYAESAESALLNWNDRVKDNGQSYPSLLRAYIYYLEQKSIVYIRGTDEELKEWRNKISKKIINNIMIIYLKEGEKVDLLSNDRPYKKGGVAYLCQNQTCLPAIYSTQELINYFK